MTREEKVDALEWYCAHCRDTCAKCKLKKLYDSDINKYINDNGCVFGYMDDKMLDKIYNWYKELDPAPCKNAEAKCCDVEPDADMVNHPKNIVEEMRHLFDLFDNNVEISINKLNKMVDIRIQM